MQLALLLQLGCIRIGCSLSELILLSSNEPGKMLFKHGIAGGWLWGSCCLHLFHLLPELLHHLNQCSDIPSRFHGEQSHP
jgi:hypothetical protein